MVFSERSQSVRRVITTVGLWFIDVTLKLKRLLPLDAWMRSTQSTIAYSEEVPSFGLALIYVHMRTITFFGLHHASQINHTGLPGLKLGTVSTLR